MESPTSTYEFLYEYTYIDTYRYVLYEQLCTYLVRIIRTNMWGCLVQVGNGIELDTVGRQFEPYQWLPCVVTWDTSRTVVVIKLRWTSALQYGIGPDLYIFMCILSIYMYKDAYENVLYAQQCTSLYLVHMIHTYLYNKEHAQYVQNNTYKNTYIYRTQKNVQLYV